MDTGAEVDNASSELAKAYGYGAPHDHYPKKTDDSAWGGFKCLSCGMPKCYFHQDRCNSCREERFEKELGSWCSGCRRYRSAKAHEYCDECRREKCTAEFLKKLKDMDRVNTTRKEVADANNKSD